MKVNLYALKFFKIVRPRTWEDIDVIKRVIFEQATDTEFEVVFYLGLVSDYGMSLDLKSVKRPKEMTMSWVADYLGMTRENVRIALLSLERKIYNALYGAGYTKQEYIQMVKEKMKDYMAERNEKIIKRYTELKREGIKRGIVNIIEKETGATKSAINSVIFRARKSLEVF